MKYRYIIIFDVYGDIEVRRIKNDSPLAETLDMYVLDSTAEDFVYLYREELKLPYTSELDIMNVFTQCVKPNYNSKIIK